jgi:hypothetical protein
MMRKPSQFGFTCTPSAAFGQDNTQDSCSLYRILSKGFVKIPYPKQQERIRVFRLDAVVLFH